MRDRHPGHAARAWRGWYRKTLRCRGILAHCRWPLDTNLVEGINNKIKVIKRMAYGLPRDAHFFRKISPAFPGVGR